MKKLTGIAILLMVIAGFAFAQQDSPTGLATQWRFTTDADNYLAPQWYTDTEFEKFYGVAGFNGMANIGFAAKKENFYIGGYYGGQIFRRISLDYSDMKDDFANKENQTFKWYNSSQINSISDVNAPRPNHDIGILVGFANMGILLSFDTDELIEGKGAGYQFFNKKDVQVGGLDYAVYKVQYGNITPAIKWGMAKDLIDRGLRPAVSFSLGIFKDYRMENQYVAGSDPTAPYRELGENVTHSENRNIIGIGLDLGGITLVEKESGFKFSANLEYDLSATAYPENSVGWLDTSGALSVYKNFSAKGYKEDGADIFYTDIKESSHIIKPSFAVSWDSEKIGIGAELALPISFYSTGSTINGMITPASGGYVLLPMFTYKETGIEFAPVLGLGAQFRPIPGKLNINIGGSIGLSSIGRTTEVITSLATNDSSKDIEKQSFGTKTGLYAGIEFYFSPNVAIDLLTGVSNHNNFNFFGTTNNSITYFGTILLAVKF
ncbi:MAG: hypothetical protein FWB95_03285 [Treponema sp.]|nr:hypothetical protein [Treponema sp.]